MTPGRRIVVIGDSGSGKSTVGAELARWMGVEPIELDGLYWAPGWIPVELEAFRSAVRRVVQADEWVLIGNYRAQQSHISWPRAESIVWLDLPLAITIPRLFARSFRRWRSGEKIWGGNRERFWQLFKLWDPDASLVAWSLATRRKRRRDFTAALHDPAWSGISFHRLRSRREAREWLARVEAARAS